jgi:Zn-dependent M28 family amino/carboxypeptidase
MGMRSTLFPVSLALVCISALAVAQSPNVPEDERKGFATLGQDALRHDVSFLASDHLAGRMSMQPGDDQAVQWIAGQFAKAGLNPIALKANGLPGYEQSFAIVEYKPDRENSKVTMIRGGKPTVWGAPQAFGAFKHNIDVTAPVAFAGYGITAPGLKYDDYGGFNVKGKIVVVFEHEPQEDNAQSTFYGVGNTKYATARVKMLNAQAHGAVGVIFVPEPNRKHLTNAERVAKIGGSTQRTEPLPLQAIANDELSIPSVTVTDAVAKELFASLGTTASDLQAKIDASLIPQSVALPDTTVDLHFHNLSEDDGHISNVVGLLKGSDARLSAETILISAHHDHDGTAACAAGMGGTDQDGQNIPASTDCKAVWHGADDNASGTAGVIALARAFAANNAKPKRSILFVVFAGEERGLLGSYWMVQHPLRTLGTTRAMLNFDMIGRDEKASSQTDGLIDVPADTTNRLNLVGAEYSPSYRAVVEEANSSGIGLTLDDRFDHDSALNVLFRSDQFPFLLRGIPALWWFTGFHPDYHHVTDTAEKIDYAKMNKILQLAYLSTWRFATDASTPVFVDNPLPTPPPGASVAADAPAGPDGTTGSTAAAPEPHHHRPVAPVNLGTGANSAAPPVKAAISPASLAGTPASTEIPATPGPADAPAKVVAPAPTTATPAPAPATNIVGGPIAHPPITPVSMAGPPPVSSKPQAVLAPVIKVKLGGKQAGEDDYNEANGIPPNE